MSLDDKIRKKQRKIEDLDRRMKYMEKHKKLAGKIHGLHSDIDGVLEQVNEAEAHLEHTQYAVSMVEGDLDSLKGMVEELQDSR